jgi:hypothetical protein
MYKIISWLNLCVDRGFLLPCVLDRCVLSAVLGIAAVVWYSLGGHISEEEMEHEARVRMELKAQKRRFFKFGPVKS